MMKDLFKIALEEYGVQEIEGDNHEERILQYFREIGQSWVKNDETAWCSAFLNWCAKRGGYKYSGKLNARSWLEVGEETHDPSVGDICVFWRESPRSWKGHVGIFVKKVNNLIYVLGGNQNNMVCIKSYPSDRLIQYRRIE
jgi:uncharacterized protein (TIGR02594 family)